VKIRGERIGVAHIEVAAALLLALAAAFAGTPDRARNARLDVESLSHAVEHEDDHVTAIELAEWIKDRRAGLRIVDIRSTDQFAAGHIPTAERIPLGDLSKTPFRRDETIVLYSEGGAHAGQGWVFLRALGYTQVYWLRGGIEEWQEEVMSPTLESTASDSARKAFKRVSDLSRYFGGAPHVGSPDLLPAASRLSPTASRAPTASRFPLPASRRWGRGC